MTVLVVGASSGIGRATALLFAREGSQVMAAARREDLLVKLREEGAGHGLAIAVADVSDVRQMEKLAEAAGSIDVFNDHQQAYMTAYGSYGVGEILTEPFLLQF